MCILTSASEGQGRSKFISFFCICFATRIICGHMSTFTYCILFIESSNIAQDSLPIEAGNVVPADTRRAAELIILDYRRLNYNCTE